MFRWIIGLVCIILAGCSQKPTPYKIALDPTWTPLNLEERRSHILGFTTELLQEVATQNKIDLSLIQTNFDNLFRNLQNGSYDAILSFLTPYSFNKAVYDFSTILLPLGPVLILPLETPIQPLSELHKKEIGVLLGSQEELLLEIYPTLYIKTYDQIGTLLNDCANGQIDGALLPILSAKAYVQDLYQKQLKIASEPLTNEAIRLICLKGKAPKLIEAVNQSISSMQAEHRYSLLLNKWNL